MIVLSPERGTEQYRSAHRGRVSASDCRALMAADGTKLREGLIERLVLDREGVDDHRYEHPDPWAEQHDGDLVMALAAYRRLCDPAARAGGLYGSDSLTFLCAPAHAWTGANVALFRVHRSLRAYHELAGRIDRAWRVRTLLTAFVCEAPSVDVVDFWDGRGRVVDRLATQSVPADLDWLASRAFPRLLSLWSAVRARLAARRIAFPGSAPPVLSRDSRAD